jgi:hypothetical protein
MADPNDFFFIIDDLNRVIYYSRVTKKRIKKIDIPPEIINQVKQVSVLNRKKRRVEDDIFDRYKTFFESIHPPKKARDILTENGIKTKADWKKWILQNHPDKGGKDGELFQKIFDAGKSKWS